MTREDRLWTLMPAKLGVQSSWLHNAARRCQEHQCESCITTLVEAAKIYRRLGDLEAWARAALSL